MEEIVYLNGALVPRAQAKISAFDFGFLYGYGLFETMRAYHGKIFLLDRHIRRLLESAKLIGLNTVPSGTDLEKACVDTLTVNRLKDARLRLTVTRGEAEGMGKGGTATVLVTARNYSPLPAELYEKGFRAHISTFQRCSQSSLSRLKTTNYLISLLAKAEAEKSGLDEALLLNEQGAIAEGSISNVFFVAQSGLVTPSVESGILPGVTREVVLELARDMRLGVIEHGIKIEDLSQFDEAFLTNSVMEIMPLVEVRAENGKRIAIGSGKPGKITRSLLSAYRELVERETGQ